MENEPINNRERRKSRKSIHDVNQALGIVSVILNLHFMIIKLKIFLISKSDNHLNFKI